MWKTSFLHMCEWKSAHPRYTRREMVWKRAIPSTAPANDGEYQYRVMRIGGTEDMMVETQLSPRC